MTDEEWLATYLTRFGIDTMWDGNIQEGEADFLMDMSIELRLRPGERRGAWTVIRDTYDRRLYGERTP